MRRQKRQTKKSLNQTINIQRQGKPHDAILGLKCLGFHIIYKIGIYKLESIRAFSIIDTFLKST